MVVCAAAKETLEECVKILEELEKQLEEAKEKIEEQSKINTENNSTSQNPQSVPHEQSNTTAEQTGATTATATSTVTTTATAEDTRVEEKRKQIEEKIQNFEQRINMLKAESEDFKSTRRCIGDGKFILEGKGQEFILETMYMVQLIGAYNAIKEFIKTYREEHFKNGEISKEKEEILKLDQNEMNENYNYQTSGTKECRIYDLMCDRFLSINYYGEVAGDLKKQLNTRCKTLQNSKKLSELTALEETLGEFEKECLTGEHGYETDLHNNKKELPELKKECAELTKVLKEKINSVMNKLNSVLKFGPNPTDWETWLSVEKKSSRYYSGIPEKNSSKLNKALENYAKTPVNETTTATHTSQSSATTNSTNLNKQNKDTKTKDKVGSVSSLINQFNKN